MIRKRTGRVATAFTIAALLGVVLASTPVSAGQPGWKFEDQTYLPATVGDGQIAGYSFTIANRGTSNISALYLTDTVDAAPVYFTADRAGCVTSPNLFCSFGPLNAQATIHVKIAYRVGTSNFTDTFRLDSTGDPSGKNNSHGDSKLQAFTTTVSSSQNFDGGFALDDATYQTGGSLGRQNKQTTIIETTDSLIPVTVEDGGPDSGVPCLNTDADCADATLIGEWSVLNVNGGATGEPIKVTIMIWGGAVPGGVGVGDIYLLHADGLGGATAITQTCDATHSNLDCLVSVTKVGNNFKIVAWFAHNGAGHGAF